MQENNFEQFQGEKNMALNGVKTISGTGDPSEIYQYNVESTWLTKFGEIIQSVHILASNPF